MRGCFDSRGVLAVYLAHLRQCEMPHSSRQMVKELGDSSDYDNVNNVDFEVAACRAEKLMEYTSRA